ncbi:MULTISPECIES: Orn/Lys/Arg decarboxylase N-terminal domain-containing protein [Dyella]|uniref:Arginine decarboxylase n=2 Tax=Dyella TaxID=231454 RepID=A0A4R0YWU5_9GAMM|nr:MULTISPECIES: Orn/Lys/Arg decarboxylase N-terminal domain-containing protein [Dyella]TBR39371.1 arginine decarboxylase [Dyella terrae]TCI13041.1 arginine decarboxylase [Dyella soli]
MSMNHPWMLYVTTDLPDEGSVYQLALARLGHAIQAQGIEVVRAMSCEDGLAVARGKPSYSVIAIDWNLGETAAMGEAEVMKIVHAVRDKSLRIPIFLLTRSVQTPDIPLGLIREVREYVNVGSETPEFFARRVKFAVDEYHAGLLPPYFKALKKLTEEGAYQWDAPGHMGGAAYLKHPAGAEFHEFFGENIMRADIGISNPELGSWLDIEGAPAESQRMAARVFGADWTFYVLAGSSASNRIVAQTAVGKDEMVIADRNCHKSLNHAMTLCGARPVYFQPSRNGYGMIGPIPPKRFTKAHIQSLIAKSPLSAGASAKEPVYAVVTNPTYDGLMYNVDKVTELLAESVPRVHFDEAWYPYGKFHPLYRQRYAMGVPRNMKNRPTVLAVQSTHKMLPAFSMASYIHVSNSERGAIPWAPIKEAFMMHGTTSPYYPLIASLDIATAMMDDPSGPALLRETMEMAVAFRRTVSLVNQRLKDEDEWFFNLYQPPTVSIKNKRIPIHDAPIDALANDPAHWTLKVGDSWHGLPDEVVKDGFCMLDPTKVTILCPGTDAQGKLAKRGVPGAILSKYLGAHRQAIARTGDYTVLVLFSVGTTQGKWGTLLETLLSFKRHYDRNALLDEALPELVQAYPDRYRGMSLAMLCGEMHAVMTESNLQDMANLAGETLSEQVLTPAEAYQHLIHENTEEVRLSDLPGRIAALMIVPYPPGIPVLMPGERVDPKGGPIVRFLEAVEAYGKRFPGFGREVQNVHPDASGDMWVRVIVEKTPPAKAARSASKKK